MGLGSYDAIALWFSPFQNESSKTVSNAMLCCECAMKLYGSGEVVVTAFHVATLVDLFHLLGTVPILWSVEPSGLASIVQSGMSLGLSSRTPGFLPIDLNHTHRSEPSCGLSHLRHQFYAVEGITSPIQGSIVVLAEISLLLATKTVRDLDDSRREMTQERSSFRRNTVPYMHTYSRF